MEGAEGHPSSCPANKVCHLPELYPLQSPQVGKATGFLKNFLVEPFVPHTQVCVRWLPAGSLPSGSAVPIDPKVMKAEIKLLEKSQSTRVSEAAYLGSEDAQTGEFRDEGKGLVCSRQEPALVTEGTSQCWSEKDLKGGPLPQSRSHWPSLDCQPARQWPLCP